MFQAAPMVAFNLKGDRMKKQYETFDDALDALSTKYHDFAVKLLRKDSLRIAEVVSAVGSSVKADGSSLLAALNLAIDELEQKKEEAIEDNCDDDGDDCGGCKCNCRHDDDDNFSF